MEETKKRILLCGGGNEVHYTIDIIEKEKKRHREKYFRLNYKEKYKPTKEKKSETIKRYEKKYPEKYKAKLATSNMKREKGMNLHHWSYNEKDYKDVIQLTIEKHNLAHRFIIYDQERMMYRRIDTMELLDTKQKHEQYIYNLPF
jgi:hypothetical protein